MFLIGSRAAVERGLKLNRPVDQSDWDIIGTKAEMDFFLLRWKDAKVKESGFPGKYHITLPTGIKIEFDATNNLSNHLLNAQLNSCKPVTVKIEDFKVLFFVPSQETLFQIKRSHANFDVHFMKTIMDVRAMMKQWNITDPAAERQHNFYHARHDEAKARFGKRQERIKLAKTNEAFFKGGEKLRTYVHDDLHRAVASEDRPLFEKCKVDLESAFVSKDIFFNKFTQEQRLNMAMEESMVIALEREYIPNRKEGQLPTERMALDMYRKGMLKEIKDLSKGWFQDFMIDNILELEKPKWNYIERFETALADGRIRTV
jgi:hypothetical protein